MDRQFKPVDLEPRAFEAVENIRNNRDLTRLYLGTLSRVQKTILYAGDEIGIPATSQLDMCRTLSLLADDIVAISGIGEHGSDPVPDPDVAPEPGNG